MSGSYNQILSELGQVRFKFKKAQYIILLREQFTKNGQICIKSVLNSINCVYSKREWLVENVKGLGYKEASHFLRNIGYGNEIAILDRHILRNLKLFGVIKNIPISINKKTYLDIEKKMINFSNTINIPMDHLDLLFWYKERGEVFK